MTREETKKCIEVMQAYVDGKEIEANVSCGDATWNVVDDILWNWWSNIYRIKEEPKPFGEGFQLADPLTWEYLRKFRDKLRKEEGFTEEPEPFDWRGKNIQWVRYSGITYKVLDVNDKHITAFNYLDLKTGLVSYKSICIEGLNNFEWQWSEDNATWRKFE